MAETVKRVESIEKGGGLNWTRLPLQRAGHGSASLGYERQHFRQPFPADGDAPPSVWHIEIDADTWREMGCPDEVTVTVEAGNRMSDGIVISDPGDVE